MSQIQITRNTIVNGIGAVETGRKLTVGKEITAADAKFLIVIGKAVEVDAKKAKTKSEKADAPPAGEGDSDESDAAGQNPLIVKAMELAGVESVEELRAFSDEELLAVNGIGEGMLKAIRKLFEE